MSFFSHISDVLNKIVHGLAHLFSKENIKKAESIAQHVSDLAAIALPFVERFAKLTEGTEDDELVAAAAKMNISLRDILSEPDDSIRKGRILTLIGNATRAKIQDLVADSGGEKIKIGSISIRVPEDVSLIAGNLFDLAAQAAYSLFVRQQATA
jgi:hypothetical protein